MDLEGSEQAWYLACKNIIVNDQSRPNAVGHQYLRKHSTAQTTDGSIPFMTTAGCWSEYYHDGKKDIRDLGKEVCITFNRKRCMARLAHSIRFLLIDCKGSRLLRRSDHHQSS